jgi:MFS family permease
LPEKQSKLDYKWVALSNTTLGVLLATIDGSIVLIAMPAIFRGIRLDPLEPGNSFYLLWMILGFLVVSSVLVVSLGRLGDQFGRVRMYNLGFIVYTVASLLLTIDWMHGRAGADWLISFRIVQGVGAAFLVANSVAILTDAFPANQRGLALGINNVVGISGMFIGLVLGGLLAPISWRLVFLVSVPAGIAGTIWSYRSLREIGVRTREPIDWAGNLAFAAGLVLVMVGITYGIRPYGNHPMGWMSPVVEACLSVGAILLTLFVVVELRSKAPMFRLQLFRIRAFSFGVLSSFLSAISRGGLMFMLIIWLQGIWLPLHGYSFSETPLWAGIYLLPLTTAFLISGPVCGYLSDRFGARGFATAGMLVFAASFVGLMLLPVDFPYWAFAALITLNGIGVGMFSAPNSASIMSSVPARQRGAASGMRSTFQNTGTALSIGVFFSLMIAGLATSLPGQLLAGLQHEGVSHAVAQHVANLPPVSSLFAAVLGENPVVHLLGPTGALSSLSLEHQHILTGTEFFPRLIASAFHHGLVVVFSVATGLSLLAAAASLLRGGRYVDVDPSPSIQGAPNDRPDRPPTRGAARDGLSERDRRHARRA